MTTEDIAETPAFPAPQPAGDLHQLDFLLGSFRADWVNMGTAEETTGVGWWKTAPALGGFVYEMWQQAPGPDITGRWTFGWDDGDRKFFTTYHDNWGHHGSSSCAGWEDGFLNCIGEYAAFGHKFVCNERFTVVDADHFRKESFIQEDDGSWRQVDRIDCYRVTEPEA